METKIKPEGSAERRHLVLEVKRSLREVRNQISLLNRQISVKVDLKDIDLDVFDLISQAGPLSPTALARRIGQHPATVTGILDRLERDGWITRERAVDDRRAVVVRAVPERNSDVLEQFAGMDSAMDAVCADYTDEELELIAGFLKKGADAGGTAAAELQSLG
jgi:DNA-binding MarR family transcriptional regulator